MYLKNLFSNITSTDPCENFYLKKFIWFRYIFGAYITIYFLHWSYFRNDFDWLKFVQFDPVRIIFFKSIFFVITLLSLLFTIGIFRRTSAALILGCLLMCHDYLHLIFYGVNIEYISLILFTNLFIPNEKKENWHIPRFVYYSLKLMFISGLFLSGLNKILESPEWRNGTAIYGFLTDSPIYKYEFLSTYFKGNLLFLKIANYFVLFLELTFPILINIQKLKKAAYFLFFSTFIGIGFLTIMQDIALTNSLLGLFVLLGEKGLINENKS